MIHLLSLLMFSQKKYQIITKLLFQEMVEMMEMMMSNHKVVVREARCIYENEDILVEHTLMDFPDGTTEAVMSVHMLDGGKIVRTETGATLIPN